MLRLMKNNFERGLYESEEYQYKQKVRALNEKLALLERIPEAAIKRVLWVKARPDYEPLSKCLPDIPQCLDKRKGVNTLGYFTLKLRSPSGH